MTTDRQLDADEINAQCARLLGWTVRPWIGPWSGRTFYTLVDPQGKARSFFDLVITYDTEPLAWKAVPAYSTDVAAALTIISHLGHFCDLYFSPGSGWQVTFIDRETDQRLGRAYAPTAAAAICRAALVAVGSVSQDEEDARRDRASVSERNGDE